MCSDKYGVRGFLATMERLIDESWSVESSKYLRLRYRGQPEEQTILRQAYDRLGLCLL